MNRAGGYGTKGVATLGLSVLILALGLSGSDAASAREPKESGDQSDAFFDSPQIRTFHFEIPPAGIQSLKRQSRVYVPGTVREGRTVLTNVGFHLKGMGSYRTIDEKASFAVKFDEFAAGQEYFGLTKLMFNNAVQDPTYVVEWLANGLFRDAGLPAARVTHARVILNGRELGLYVLNEAMNKRFLRRHFQSAKGNLYETYVEDINTQMDQDNGESTDQADVRALVAACEIADPVERYRAVSQRLDVEQFASFGAMEVLVGHWDGYTMHTNNYRLYNDPGRNRMVFITHGLDWAFRRPNISIKPPLKSLVGRAVFTTPEGQRLFRERLGILFTNVFKVSVITNRMEQVLARVRKAGGLSPTEAARMERSAASIRERIVLRSQRVAEQLAGIEPPRLQFGPDETAPLAGWRDEWDRGEVVMDQPTIDGRRTLHMRAEGGIRCRGSWRTQVCLGRGRYRFEGRMRTEGIQGGSAGLRISGSQRRAGTSGTTPWQTMAHEFEVTDETVDVEFVCDFYGTQGEVWLDQDAFRLRKL
jgi:spore coat protein H